jgi:hypothetical protein
LKNYFLAFGFASGVLPVWRKLPVAVAFCLMFCGLQARAQMRPSSGDLPLAPPFQLTYEIEDGKTKKIVAVGAMNPKETQDNIEIESLWTKRGARHFWTTRFKNSGDVQRWLTLRWKARVQLSGERAYWPGRGEPKRAAELDAGGKTDAQLNTLPLQVAFDDQRGLALALDPMEIFSDWSVEWKTLDADSGVMTLEIPLVLDAGQSDEIVLEIFDFAPRHGHLDAVQKYYDAHPEAFWPRDNIDPRISGGGATYVVWNQNEPELARRFNGDWEWVYAPFKRTGDIYGREEFWNYTPARPITDKTRNLSREEFHKARRERLERGLRADTAMLFYTPAFIYAEEQLALEKYPGAIIRKPDGKYSGYFSTPWVTGHDNEVLMYPWGNDFSRQSQRDAKQLVEDNLNIQGFAYDVVTGSHRHRGAGLNESPRRAFDANGVYVDIAVGTALMMDFTRELERDGKKMANVSNLSGLMRSYEAARSDAAMYERPPYLNLDFLKAHRLSLGHKPLAWWDDWGLSEMLRWEEMSGEEIRQAYLGARDYVLLSSLAYGGAPTYRLAVGTPKLIRWLKPIRRILRAGWEPVPGVLPTPDTLWPARYGRGLGAYVTIGNQSRENFKGQIQIENDVLGSDNYLFAAHDGRALRQSVSGRITTIDVEIAAHEPLVLQAVARLAPNARGAATLSWQSDGAHGTVKIEGALSPLGVLPPHGEDASAKVVRNKNVWSWSSPIFASDFQKLRAFPFFDDKGASATIVLPKNAAPDEEWAAMRLQEYFNFWGRKGLTPARKIEIPIVRGEASQTGNLIVIGGENKNGAPVKLEGTRLTVSGKTPAQTRAATLALLDALDEKYFYVGQFPTSGEDAKGESAALKKAGISGGILD